MKKIAEETRPITGRGIGYKLFAAGLIPSMAEKEISKVYRDLVNAREDGIIPWDWIVDVLAVPRPSRLGKALRRWRVISSSVVIFGRHSLRGSKSGARKAPSGDWSGRCWPD